MLFAGKRKTGDPWNIFEMDLTTREVRQITRDLGDCRSPTYQGRLFTLDSPEPWSQITFVSDHAGEINEHGNLACVPVMNVVGRELKMPLDLAGVGIDRDDAV